MGQKVGLYQGLSVRENVEFYAGLFGLQGDRLEKRWAALRDRFALDEAEGERPENLPAGVRQRAGLALSMLHEPRVLFLDEPTAGVDVASRSIFWEAIQDAAASGVTVFVTTHFLEEVDYCHWVTFIDAGHIVADATPEDLRRRFSDGYHVAVETDEQHRSMAAERLGRLATTVARAPSGFTLTLPRLEPETLDTLNRLAADGVTVHIEQAPMNEVFRRVLLQQEVHP
jgi:ABC-type multidrug transport system ATPase subunit